MRLWAVVSLGLCLADVLISAVAHLAYGLYLFGLAVTFDMVEILNNHRLKRFRVWQAVAESYSKPNIVVSEGSRDIGNGPYFEGYELAPIVLVHGIFGFGNGKLGVVSYWAGAEKKDDRVLVPDLGSLTSVYDRARELFYYLKGGTVDYGEEHSAQYGHARFGKSYEPGYYPEWDENHPVHFVGHSTGVQVVRVLHNMLAEKKFQGHDNSSEGWVLSVTSLSGALNGTTRVYLDGVHYATRKTRKLFGVTIPSSLFGIHPLLLIRTLQMSQWCYPSNVPLPYKGYNDKDWQDNDGALNTISMLYPRFPKPHPHCWLSAEIKDGHSFQPGVWYYTIVEADHILFVVNRARAGVQFDILYDSIFQRCRKQMSRVISAVPSVDQALDHICSNVENCVCHLSGFDKKQ